METWRRPTDEEARRGFVAMFCYFGHVSLPQSEWRWFGYTIKMMNRRVTRGGVLPYWITPKVYVTAAKVKRDINDLDVWLKIA